MPSNAPRQKDALEQSIALITSSWDVFEALWEARNDVLHGGDNALQEAENNAIDSRLLQFKRESHLLLRQCNRHFINKPELVILNWPKKKKKERLLNLERLHRVYVIELKREAELLRPIILISSSPKGVRRSFCSNLRAAAYAAEPRKGRGGTPQPSR